MTPDRIKYLRDHIGEWDMTNAEECLVAVESLRADYQLALDEVNRLKRALRMCARNDGTEYAHHQKRRWDGLEPMNAPEPGSIWLTPREIARATLGERSLATFDDRGEP